MKQWVAAAAALAVAAAVFLRPPGAKQAIVMDSPPPARPAVHRRTLAAPAVSIVYVAGAVRSPGIYRLPPGARGIDALERAGGFRGDADRAGVNLAQILTDGEELAIPVQGQGRVAAGRRSARTRSPGAAAKTAPVSPLDLNAADAATLQRLPGVGKALAQRIVRFRDLNGAFVSLDELADVAGMTPRRIEALSAMVYVR